MQSRIEDLPGRPQLFNGYDVVRILSFDGGGMRGRYQAEILSGIVSRPGWETFHRRTDLFAGTSTGAIIAAALAINTEPDEISKLYHNLGPEIFGTIRNGHRFLSMWLPKYSRRKLRNCLDRFFEGRVLKDCRNCHIYAVSLQTHKVTTFSSNDEDFNGEEIADIVLASCSAPTYFAPTKVKNTHFTDGGLGCNNPTQQILAEAYEHGADPSRVMVTSIGNCSVPSPLRQWKCPFLPRLAWAGPVINIAMYSNAHVVEMQSQKLKASLGMKFFRIDSAKTQKVKLDDHKKASEYLPGYARERLRDDPHLAEWIDEWCQ